MPNKNGRETYDEIHKIKPDIRVLFTSGYRRDVFLDKDIDDKKCTFLQKPIFRYPLAKGEGSARRQAGPSPSGLHDFFWQSPVLARI